MDDLPDALVRLTARLEILEQRVYALEHPSEAVTSLPAMESSASPVPGTDDALPFAQAGGAFSVLGKAMLGIAGAYVLRAVAESTSLPKLAVAAIAIAYAIMWLVWATRLKTGEWLASAIYSCTSALILAPMLWELTLRFKVLPAEAAAGLLCAFVIAGSVLAWKRDLVPVFWVANITASLVAVALSIATHDMVPFIAALLLMVAICEYAAECNHELSVRPLVALAADLAIWALIFIYAGPESARAEYHVISAAGLVAPGCLLFLIYAASVIYKTVWMKQRISIFEIVQTSAAFLLAACGLLYFERQTGAILLGVACLLLSAASYAFAHVCFALTPERRNYHVFSAWSMGLFLAGSFLCMAPFWLAICLGLAAIVATVLGVRLSRSALEIHGLVYLVAAAVSSGMLVYTFRALAWTLPDAPAWSVCLVAACAALCYVAGRPLKEEQRKQRLLRLIPAALVVGALAALLVQGLLWLVALRMTADVFHVAFIRTLTTCTMALALAYCGSRWQRVELNWIAYATLVFVAAKLLFEDLQHGHLEFIAASIFLYAITLIAVPRLARFGQKEKSTPQNGVPSNIEANVPHGR